MEKVDDLSKIYHDVKWKDLYEVEGLKKSPIHQDRTLLLNHDSKTDASSFQPKTKHLILHPLITIDYDFRHRLCWERDVFERDVVEHLV
jgi:hypothetical protein